MVHGAFRDGDYKFLRTNAMARDAAVAHASRPFTVYFPAEKCVAYANSARVGEIGARSCFATGAVSHTPYHSSATQFRSAPNPSHDFDPVRSNLYTPLPTSAPCGLDNDIPKI